MTKKKNTELGVQPKEKMIMFFFGIVFVLMLGKHYFANLGGSTDEKAELLKWYYFGLAFWIILICVLGYIYTNGF
ncbi:hypothetical protein [Maribacter sp. 4G9]|uniref:hypothetical protein n=1 Tax=Maribacter sp. 4G9 TaxID=1889777 RepID=UPI000C158FC6|nr:hypothetical protein [Maribacter sp. 4G9]PIB30621.1 hypothetical protein BFP75_02495 [Maribacter sp. 4G9]